MKTPWSPEELNEIFKTDSGFRNLLGSFAPSERDFIEKLLASGTDIAEVINSLPIQIKGIAETFLSTIYETPQKALDLFQQCRFFEARDLLLKTIDIYTFQDRTMPEVVNTALVFATKRVQALSYNLLGDVEWELGNSERAGHYYHQALDLAEEISDVDTIAKAMQGLGVYYWDLADIEKGLSYCNQALEVLTGHNDRWRTTNKALTSLGIMYSELGKHEKSLEYSKQAVEFSIQNGDLRILPIALNNLAILYLESSDFDQAKEALEMALEIARQERNLRQEILILNNYSICRLRLSTDQGEVDLVSDYLGTALTISREISSRSLLALTLGNLGLIYQLTHRAKEAGEALRQSVEIYQQIGARSCEVAALQKLGNHMQEHEDDPEGACRAYQKAIDLVENIRGGLKREDHRIGYTDMAVEPYRMLIEIFLGLGKAEDALMYVERAKSRALLEFLSLQLRDTLPVKGDKGSVCRVLELLGEIEEIRKSLEAIQRQEERGTEPEIESGAMVAYNGRLTSLLDRLAEKECAFNQVCEELNILEPESASLAKVLPITTEEIKNILDPDSVFLELFQSDDVLHLFIVAHTGPVRVVTIDLSCEEAMEGVWSLLAGLRDTRTLDIRSHDYIREMRQPLALFHDLLISSLKPYLDSCRRIIIAPHLFWHYLPFQALYDQEEKKYLCDQYEIIYSPSASVLRICLGKNRIQHASAVIFARNNGDLPHAEREGELLAGAFYPAGDLYKGEMAHLGQLRKRKNGSDVIHFACHGQFNHEQPFLSGVDVPPGEGEERRTFLIDFFYQKFDCSLVTLSACESGLIRFTTADELLGLSRGLFYAGAAAVLLSLWQVADESTCYLMENFYWHYVKNGRSKSSALQLAMQAVKVRPEYAHPYYWAPFVVMGDWR